MVTKETPYLSMDLDVVSTRYGELRAALPQATVLYAVKANPSRRVIRRLNEAGSSFDVASPGEIKAVLGCGVDPSRLSYGNTIKKAEDIAFARKCGVGTFTVDCEPELDKVISQAPGSTVYVRITTDGAGADWPLSRKFGCPPLEALHLLRKAIFSGLSFGISFHVGSQQRNPNAWDAPLQEVAAIYDVMRREGHRAVGVNLGGGLPSSHSEPTPDVAVYGVSISKSLGARLGSDFEGRVFVEPGRYLVGDAGVIESEVVLIAQRSGDPDQRWVYLDVGMFNGLTETLDEAIRYRIRVPARTGALAPAVLAGPTCDSADVLYERQPCWLPEDLRIGDRVQLLSTGAYTASYSSVGFNGFSPLRSIFRTSRQHQARVTVPQQPRDREPQFVTIP